MLQQRWDHNDRPAIVLHYDTPPRLDAIRIYHLLVWLYALYLLKDVPGRLAPCRGEAGFKPGPSGVVYACT